VGTNPQRHFALSQIREGEGRRDIVEQADWGDRNINRLRTEAIDARRRYEVHKLAVHDQRRADPVRLKELRRVYERASDRLARLESAIRAAEAGNGSGGDGLDETARIEIELRRNPDRADTKIARASGAPFTAVRAVRERLGLYITRPR
jgi:hypothetical protein